MDENFSNEMQQLNCLLEKHKQLQERSVFKLNHQSQEIQNNLNLHCNMNNYYRTNNYITQEKLPISTMGKVYVNPNYTKRKPVIHVNPYINVKSTIHINPKLIQNMTNSQNQEQISKYNVQNIYPLTQSNVQTKCSVHVNPKLMTKLISKVPEKDQTIIEEHRDFNTSSIAVVQKKLDSSLMSRADSKNVPLKNISSNSPNLRKKNSSNTTLSQKKYPKNYVVQSRTKLVKYSNNLKKSPNTSLVALSQRKLVRIKKSPKIVASSSNQTKFITPTRKKLSCSEIKKIKINPKNINNAKSQLLKINNFKLMTSIDKYKINWYNRCMSKLSSKKKINASKIIINNSVGLVSIGGIMYKTSRNQLVRSSPSASSSKRRRSLTTNKNNQYYIAKNGKKLLKLDSVKKKVDNSSLKLNTLTTFSKNYKTSASNKVKQRSLEILRNKMRKNNQPCLLFQRFGYCSNQVNGTCSKLHDKKQVALCKNFLQGKCLLDNCPLSHNVGPEKMPTCKYFLEGCCNREKCPYLHVKVSSKNPICVEFLRGYCLQGNECQKRHIFACPEFDKNGSCSKGKSCPYPHKSHLTEIKKFRRIARHKSNTPSVKESDKTLKELKNECRKRYYDEIDEDLSKKRTNLLKHVKIIKDVHLSQLTNSSVIHDDNSKQSINNKASVNYEERQEVLCNPSRRPPIGPLPAYIPIE